MSLFIQIFCTVYKTPKGVEMNLMQGAGFGVCINILNISAKHIA